MNFRALRLGIKLAFRGTPHGRWRTVALGLSALLVTAVALGAYAMLGSRAAAQAGFHDFGQLPLYAVLLPLGVLSVTAGRLSAALRQQRGSRLHLLGATPADVRWVAVGETGAVALLGWLVGLAAGVWFGFSLAAVLASAVLAPGLVALSAATLPLESRRAVEVSKGASSARPGACRPVPLALGVLMVALGRALLGRVGELAPALIALGCGVMAIGALLFLPLVVRLFAGWLVARKAPVATIAGRRLLAQPGAQTRVLAGLLVSLAVATGVQGVVATYSGLSPYQGGLRDATVETHATVGVAEGADVEALRARLEGLSEVRAAVVLREAAVRCDDFGHCANAAIGTCSDLHTLYGPVEGCREDQAAVSAMVDVPGEVLALADPLDFDLYPVVVEVPVGPDPLVFDGGHSLPDEQPLVFVPASLVGSRLDVFPPTLHVIADPGFDLDALTEDPDVVGFGGWDHDEFQAMQRIVAGGQLLTYVVLVVGLASVAMGATDRALERRHEVIRLQLVGVPPGLLVRSHWLEVGVPLVVGMALSIGLGWFAADSYAAYTDAGGGVIRAALTGYLLPVAASAAVGGLLITAVTSLAANPRIRPDLIRAA